MYRLKLLWRTSKINYAYMSSKSSKSLKSTQENYYDILKIKSDATQLEIKTAYYELTKKYHPDRNVTDQAKEKFQEASEAYEVLGNPTSRNDYDRMLSIKGSTIQRNYQTAHTYRYKQSTTIDDPLMKLYRGTDKPQSRGQPIFNFDVWNREHYGTIQSVIKKNKRTQEMVQESREEIASSEHKKEVDQANTDVRYILILLMTVTALIVIFYDDALTTTVKKKN